MSQRSMTMRPWIDSTESVILAFSRVMAEERHDAGGRRYGDLAEDAGV